jgi:hypothetical protein
MLALWQHTLLGNAVGLCWALGITLHWVMSLVYVGPWATQYTLLGNDTSLGNGVGLGNTPYRVMYLVYVGQHFTG